LGTVRGRNPRGKIPEMQSVPQEMLAGARPSRLLALALGDWAAIAMVSLASSLLPAEARAWAYPFVVILIAGRFHALGVVLHDAAHMPRGRKTPALRALEFLAGYPIGTTIDAMRYHHLRHHRDLGRSADPYLKAWVGRSRLRFWVMSLRYFLLVPLWILRAFYGAAAANLPALRESYARLFLQDRSGDCLTTSAEVIACAREDRWQALFFAGVAALAAFQWRWLALYYFAPLVIAGYLAGYRLLVEHKQEHIAGEDAVRAIVELTRNHDLGFVGGLLLAPHNVGYHLVHHLHPQAGLEQLPALQRWYEERGILPAEADERDSGAPGRLTSAAAARETGFAAGVERDRSISRV
jgi:fatty acid desaturase